MGKKQKRKQLKHAFMAVFLLLCLLVAAALDSRLTVSHHALRMDHLSQPIRLMVVTDLHSCRYGQGQQELIAAIARTEPDLVLLVGDIADDRLPHVGTIELLEGIAGEYPCYYVTGNHEIWSGEVDAIKAMFRSYGVTVLEGDCIPLTIRGQRLDLCGVDDPDLGEDRFSTQLASAFEQTEQGVFTILMSHRPERLADYAGFGFDLVLSGHAHGGQWRIPFFVAGVYAPNQGTWPQYTSGFYQAGDTRMLVSRGLARETTRLPRIFNRPELVVLDLVPE